MLDLTGSVMYNRNMLSVQHLQHAYFGHPMCLNDICADFAEGVSVLFGCAGSGKTSLLKCLAGLNAPMQGEITLDGQPLRCDKATPVGMVFDDLGLLEHRSLWYNLCYPLRLRKVPKAQWQDTIDAVCKDWDIPPIALQVTARRAPMALRVKAALARVCLVPRRVLLLDNPLAGLTIDERNILFAALAAHLPTMAQYVVYATDSADEARALDAPTLLLSQGYGLAIGKVRDLAADPPCLYAAQALVPLYNAHEATAKEGVVHTAWGDVACHYPAVYEGHTVLVGVPPDKVGLVPDANGQPVRAVVWRWGKRYVQAGGYWAADEDATVGQTVCLTIGAMDIHLYDVATELRLNARPNEEL